MRVLDAQVLDKLIQALRDRGYTVVGPTVRDGAVVYDEIASPADLPRGWTDRQEAARYRMEHRSDDAWFGFNTGPQSWKKFLFPPFLRLFRATRGPGRKVHLEPETHPAMRYAFLGVRPCELAALAAQDKVFLGGPYQDPLYKTRREAAFVVAVQCGQAGGTCFCTSLGTGPGIGGRADGYDLVLTEILEDGRHDFVIDAGTDRGAEVLANLPGREAEPADVEAAVRVVARAAGQVQKSLHTEGLHDLLLRNYENRCWDGIADRCLACGNCTLVCPTCFCSTVEDVTDLGGTAAERHRRWDSCFTYDFSYLHGGSVRHSVASRYRQWMLHKLATWQDQFGMPGCVGCGRCITWCPAAIDLTEEARALRAGDAPASPAPGAGTS
jgi:ferredoxin